MKRILTTGITMILLLSLPGLMTGQSTLKLRISGTSTRFMNEPQGDEKIHPDILGLSGGTASITQFIHKGELGIEAELMMSLSDKVFVGFEVGSDRMSGENDSPGYYNFQFTDQLQLKSFGTDPDTTFYWQTNSPLTYQTNLINFVGNLRVYPAPYGRFKPFIKVSAGMALVGTELKLKAPGLWETYVKENYPNHTLGEPVLFSRGGSGAPEGYKPALLFGGGIGFELQLTDKIALIADGSYRIVNSGILDGRPNFDWKENPEWNTDNPDYDPNYQWIFGQKDPRGELEPFNTKATIGKLTFGIVYTLGDNLSVTGGGSKRGRQVGGGTSKTSPYLPFFKLKRL